MEKRKNPEKDLRNKSGLFFQIGLLMAMMLVVSAFEYRVPKEIVLVPEDITSHEIPDEIIPITRINPPPPPPPKPILANPVVAEPEEVVIDEDIVIDFDVIDDPVVEVVPEPEIPEIEEPDVYKDYVEERPSFDGFYAYLGKTIKYPAVSRRLRSEGKVFVGFIVDENGKVADAEVIKGVDKYLDAEALRVVKESPDWSPGRQGGRRVKVRMVVPVIFTIN